MSGGAPETGGRQPDADIEALIYAGGIGHVALPEVHEQILRSVVNGGHEGPVMPYRGIFAHDTQVPRAAMGDGEFTLVQSKIIE